MSCRDGCAKFFLYAVNSLLVLAGLAFLAIGTWIAVSPSSFSSEALHAANSLYTGDTNAQTLVQLFLTNSSLLMIGCYMILAIGGFLVLVGLCGFCGARNKSKCLLFIYVLVSCLAFIAVLAAGIIEAVFQNQAADYITQGFAMLQSQLFDGLGNSANPLSVFWYSVMQNFACCGLNGPTDFTTYAQTKATKWSYAQSTCTPAGVCYGAANGTLVLPACCCILNGTSNNALLSNSCPYTGLFSNHNSCQDSIVGPLSATLQKYAKVIMGITFGLDVICLMAVIAAGVLFHDGKNRDEFA